MPLSKLMELDTDTEHAVLISGQLSWLPNETGSETDGEGASIERQHNKDANFLADVLLPGLADVPERSDYHLIESDLVDF